MLKHTKRYFAPSAAIVCVSAVVTVICMLLAFPNSAFAEEAFGASTAPRTSVENAQATEAASDQSDLEQESADTPAVTSSTTADKSPASPAIHPENASDNSLAAQSALTQQSSSEGAQTQNQLDAQSEAAPNVALGVRAHVQNDGWQSWEKANGSGNTVQVGTTGRSLRMEELEFSLAGAPGGVQVQAHVQNIGWQAVGTAGGTHGKSLRVEAIRIMLTGEASEWYDVSYCAHVQNLGWRPWTSNGGLAGTTGQSLRVEAFQIKLVKKGSETAPSEGIVDVRTQAHVQNDGWGGWTRGGETAGTSGRGLRMEALCYQVDPGVFEGGIECNAHVQNIGWTGYGKDAAGTTGRGLRMEAMQFKLTGPLAEHYDVVYRAHVQNLGWQPWTLNGGVAGTTGQSLRVEALQIKLMRKGDTSLADGGYIITTILDPNMALIDPGASESAGTQMQVQTPSGGYAQRFYLKNVGNGNITLQSVASALYLTDSAGAVVQLNETGSNDQRWRLVWDSGYNIINLATGKSFALAASPSNGTIVNTAAKNAADSLQHWMFQDAGVAPDGVYVITNVPSGRVLDIWQWKRSDGGEIKIGNANGGNNQKFTIAHLGGNQYSVRNVITKRAVQTSDTHVNLWAYSGANNQKWRIEIAGPKTFRFVNIGNEQAMDIANGSTANGSSVLTSWPSTAESQKFTLSETSAAKEVVNIGVPVIYQNPELPTGCESVALTEALNYYGFGLSKTTIADHYMPWSGYDFVYSFMGNPHTDYGAAIMAPGITNTANDFLVSNGSSLRATELTGASLGSLFGYLDRGAPVVVWNTMYMYEPGGVEAYQDGYEMRPNTHAVTLSGYDPFNDAVLVADPLSGRVWRDRWDFERLYDIMGRQAVVIE